jgi:hypothetical protein
MYSCMKIRFLRTLAVEIEDSRMGETWDKTYFKWTELLVENVYKTGNLATLKTYEGQYLVGVPADSFEVVSEKKKLDIA